VGSFGVQELLIILLIVFVLFGAKKVPEIMKSFGQGIREFKRESSKIVADLEAPARSPVVETAALPESTEGQAPRPSG
jgi:sec-independent protein translocase protein TatA